MEKTKVKFNKDWMGTNIVGRFNGWLAACSLLKPALPVWLS